jgi:predicted dehydrogenase
MSNHILIIAQNPGTGAERAAECAPLRGVRILQEFPDEGMADLADLSLLPTAALHDAIRDAGGRCRAVLLPPDAALPPDGERIQNLLRRNKLHGFIRNDLFLHPAVARVLEVADGGCLGTVCSATLTRRPAPAETAAGTQALALLFARRYLPACGPGDVFATRSADEHSPGWEIGVTGTAGTISAWAIQAGGGTVRLVGADGGTRNWDVPVESPARLCLAAALTCLARKEPLAFIDFKAAVKALAVTT